MIATFEKINVKQWFLQDSCLFAIIVIVYFAQSLNVDTDQAFNQVNKYNTKNS